MQTKLQSTFTFTAIAICCFTFCDNGTSSQDDNAKYHPPTWIQGKWQARGTLPMVLKFTSTEIMWLDNINDDTGDDAFQGEFEGSTGTDNKGRKYYVLLGGQDKQTVNIFTSLSNTVFMWTLNYNGTIVADPNVATYFDKK